VGQVVNLRRIGNPPVGPMRALAAGGFTIRGDAQLVGIGSGCVSDDENRPRRLFQFSDPNGMSAQQPFNLGRSVVAVLEVDHLGRCAAGSDEIEKIGIRCNDSEPVRPCILPDRFV
jgi:hypothetical protein